MPLPEKLLIAQIRRLAKTRDRGRNSRIPLGIGDDCAVLHLSPRDETLVTTDLSLEGIHFRRGWHSPESVGHRCLARGLSDIAAMGGDPVAAFLSLALPPELPQSWVGRFLRSLIRLAGKHGIELAGGDTAESPAGILADVIVIGTVPKGKAILRSAAHPGNRIYVSGNLGGSAAAILRMRARPEKKLNPAEYPRHFFPEPRIKLGRLLREKGFATAMIDTSDGLSTDLAHICEESGVGAEIAANLIPRARVGRPAHPVDLDLAMHGGEDYELLFTAPAARHIPRQIAGLPLTQIGHITPKRGIVVRDSEGVARKLEPRGWEHFRP